MKGVVVLTEDARVVEKWLKGFVGARGCFLSLHVSHIGAHESDWASRFSDTPAERDALCP